jgi:hypothetical protein
MFKSIAAAVLGLSLSLGVWAEMKPPGVAA